MRLEYVWPHLPTPVFYAIVMVQVAAFITVQNTNLATFVSLIVIALAFGASSLDYVRPFHIERLAVVSALVLSYLAVAEALPELFLETIHAHGSLVPYLVRGFYNLLWALVAATALVGYWRNPTTRTPVLWLVGASFAGVLALLPLEVALPREPGWVVFVRFNVSFFIYLAVSVGDAAFLTERAYQKAAKQSSSYGEEEEEVEEQRLLADNVDISLSRTLFWIPLAVWALYIKPILLVLPLLAFAFLAYIAFVRWRLAACARDRFESGKRPKFYDCIARPGRPRRPATVNMGELGEVCIEQVSKQELVSMMVSSRRNRQMRAIDPARRSRHKDG